MSSIFLTGGTGFLGSHIAEALVAAGHEVTCSVRASSDTRRLESLGIERVELDLGASEGAAHAAVRLAATDVVLHCGALTRARDEAAFMAVNAVGTERLVQASVEAGVGKFVLISSLAARGPDGAPGPISPYGRSKAAAEAALADRGGSMTRVILRPGGVYGPRDSDLLPLFRLVKRGWTVVPRSETPLQPVFVSDVVSAVLASLDAPAPRAPLAIAGREIHTWRELADALAGSVGRAGRLVRLPPALFWLGGLASEIGARVTGNAPAMDRRRARDMSVHSWTCALDPALEALEPWEPHIDIRQGLGMTAKWYVEQGWL